MNTKTENLRCCMRENPIGIEMNNISLSWRISSDAFDIMQIAYQIQVSMEDESFCSLVWDTGKVDSDRSVHIKYVGKPLKPLTRYYYRVKVWYEKDKTTEWSNAAYWETGFESCDDWTADWITTPFKYSEKEPEPAVLLRTGFNVKGEISRARIYASSLGLYEMGLNGERVGSYYLTPGWTSYNKNLQYQTYDITDMINEGDNAIGIVLGEGWYKGTFGCESKKNLYGDRSAALLEIHITLKNGKKQIIITDSNWKVSEGPILKSEIYHGELYDARKEKTGWDNTGFKDDNWSTAIIYNHSKEILVPQENEPITIKNELSPIDIFKTPDGDTLIDMGQNMVGMIRFNVKGKEGERVILEHAEVLDKNGNFYTENLRKAAQRVEYIIKGYKSETYMPHFTFQGFRYVRVASYPGEPKLEDFTGIVLHSDMEITGDFNCSNELVNQLQKNIIWGQKGNFLDVPTDCPQRDERMGWTGDAQVFIRTGCFNMNAALFFKKWLKDLAADQKEDGGVPFVVPHIIGEKDFSSSAWGDAAVICPWTIYLCYGDTDVLKIQYPSMKAWIEYIRKQGDNEYLWNTGFHFGDWLALDSKEDSYTGITAKDYISTAFYAYSTELLAKTAGVLGYLEDEKEYLELYGKILSAFRSEFITPGGRISVPTQTAHVLALMFNLIEEKDIKRTVDTLADYLEETEYHLATGFVGTPYLCQVLSENGLNDIAYKLLLQTDYPSWLYQIKKGATTIWEHWDGIKEDGSFWSRDMNSFNHYAYGSIGEWLYRYVAGIDTSEQKPGYKHIIIKPNPGPGLTYASASYKSMYGEISSSWKIENDEFKINVVIPCNTTASIILPCENSNKLSENIENLRKSSGIHDIKFIDKKLMLEVGSGFYSFKI